MEAIEDKLRELDERERFLLVELQAVRASIDIFAKAKNKGLSPSESPSLAGNTIPAGAPSLDGLRIRDAINQYLRWASVNGRDRIRLGELFAALKGSRVTTFRGKLLSETTFPFKTVCNSLGAPENKGAWVIEKHSDHFQEADTIGLRPEVSGERAEVVVEKSSV